MELNVVSTFDGCAMALQALKDLGIKCNYYASEIDPYAIEIAMKNHPEIIQLGDIRNIKGKDLPKIDLLIGGSPCQGFSTAGLQLNFEDLRSKLFFEFVRLNGELNPDLVVLENVKMKQEFQDIISDYMNCMPVLINSALVSAQNRNRLYWVNRDINLPENKHIYLKDIMFENSEELLKVSKKGVYNKFQNKSSCLTAGGHSGGNHTDMDLFGMDRDRCHQIGQAIGINGHDIIKRVYADYGKAPTVTTLTGGNQYSKIAVDDYIWRRLSPIECERLQTLPDNYTEGVSNSQRYKMIGNGFTVKVIEHILRGIL